MSKFLFRIGIVIIILAALSFILSTARVAFMVARANLGLWEAVIIAALGLVLVLSSRRK